jgi:uncharacterized membrane protein
MMPTGAATRFPPVPRRLMMTRLLPPPGYTNVGFGAVNERGEVAGDVYRVDAQGNIALGTDRAVVWKGARPRFLELFKGTNVSTAFAINRRGLIGGTLGAEDATGRGDTAALWQGTRLVGGLKPSAELRGGAVFDVNDKNVAVGEVYLPGRITRGAVFDGTTVRVLEPIDERRTNSTINAINNRGQFVGYAYATDAEGNVSAREPFRSVKGRLEVLPILPFVNEGVAFDINDAGMICGRLLTEGGPRAVLWQGQLITDLGGPEPGDTDIFAVAVNNRGQVLLRSRRITAEGIGRSQTLLWQNGRRFNLNALLPAGSKILSLRPFGITDGGIILAGVGLAGGNGFFDYGVKIRVR